MVISEWMAQSVMNRYGPQQMQWHYEHGLALQSIFLAGKKAGRDDFCRYVQSMYDTKITPNGEIISYRKDEYNLDQLNPGKTLFLLYQEYGGERYRLAIERLRNQLRSHPRTPSGGFWHKQIYPQQMWLDGLYMYAPFYAQYTVEFIAAANAVSAMFDDIEHQFTLMESKARNGKTGLLYHAWDESRQERWANSDTGCSPHCWGRALGWYCMALADVLGFIPPACRKNYAVLAAVAGRLIAPLLRYQDSVSGLWYQVLDRGDAPDNYTESSASAMFVYFLLKMLRLGLVEDDRVAEVRAAARRAYQGLLEYKLREDNSGGLHLTGICKVAGLGGTPYRDGSYAYYVNEPIAIDDFKGIGPFILASLEIEALTINK